MKKIIRDLIKGLILGIVTAPFIFIILAVNQAWTIGIYNQIINLTITEGSFVIKDYGMVSLTLFGFTLIGGIFESKNTNNDKYRRYAVSWMFVISILFLVSFIMFHLLYTLTYPTVNENTQLLSILLVGGIFLFTLSTILLLMILILYFIRSRIFPDKSKH